MGGWNKLAKTLKAEIDLQTLDKDIRLQKIIFETAAHSYEVLDAS